MNAIEIHGLRRQFGKIAAVKGIRLNIPSGEIFGLIGPDGAGKTTLMRMLCTLLQPTAGTATVGGYDIIQQPEAIRQFLGYMPQRFSLYMDLTVEQNLQFFADLFQVPREVRQSRIEQLYAFSRLKPFRDRQAGALSGGMKQKLALSCALIHTPKILILDEPTTGVDPLSRKEFWEILKAIQQEGTTILVSTPYMDEADLCDRVGLMFRGELVATGTPEAVRRLFPYALFKVQGTDLQALRQFFRQVPEVVQLQLFGNVLHVAFPQPPPESQWLEWQRQTHQVLQHWEAISPGIEDVFLFLMEKTHAA